jgi:ribonuclease HI
MKSPYQDKLQEYTGALNTRIKAAGFSCAIDPDSWQEFSVKVLVYDKQGANTGSLRVYYAPARKRFTLDTRKLNDLSLQQLINGNTVSEPKNKVKTDSKKSVSANSPAQQPCTYIAYVDGSWINGITGYGLVILKDNQKIFEDSGTVENPLYQEARQVAGELFAVGKVIQWCTKHNITQIQICFDYAGIEAWATGKWKAKQILTQRYAAFIKGCGINIVWKKIAAHTGVEWNEYADSLAKKGTQPQ